ALRHRRRHALAVDLHRVDGGVGLVAERRDLAVDRDQAAGDQLLGLAGGGDAGAGEDLLQSFWSHLFGRLGGGYGLLGGFLAQLLVDLLARRLGLGVVVAVVAIVVER